MALAKYFSKDLLAIKQVFTQGSLEKFEELLNAHIIEIAFDSHALNKEGLATIDLLVRLFSRFYPRIKFTHIGERTSKYVDQFKSLAGSINTKVELTDLSATFTVIVGRTQYGSAGLIGYTGSDAWQAKFSSTSPVGSKNSNNPFGAGIAACLAASNVFRFVFQPYLQKDLDSQATIDLLSLNSPMGNSLLHPDLSTLELGSIHLAGMGAIGNGLLWALSFLPSGKGNLTVVDPEIITLSNLQRYVCTTESDVGKPKVDMAKEFLAASTFSYSGFESTWAKYLQNPDVSTELVATAVDSAKDRIGIQSSLPGQIINGYTETNIAGVTRHLNFGHSACLACGFVPERKMKDHSQEVADSLGIPNFEDKVRHYVAYNFPVDDNLLSWISQANGIPMEGLAEFRGQPFSNFYSDAVCGGLLLSLAGSSNLNASMEAPLAFQSALAGIMLASEVVLVKCGYRTESSLPNSTQVYPLLKINNVSNPYTTQLSKDLTMRCICNDEDFKSVYDRKWKKVNKTFA